MPSLDEHRSPPRPASSARRSSSLGVLLRRRRSNALAAAEAIEEPRFDGSSGSDLVCSTRSVPQQLRHRRWPLPSPKEADARTRDSEERKRRSPTRIPSDASPSDAWKRACFGRLGDRDSRSRLLDLCRYLILGGERGGRSRRSALFETGVTSDEARTDRTAPPTTRPEEVVRCREHRLERDIDPSSSVVESSLIDESQQGVEDRRARLPDLIEEGHRAVGRNLSRFPNEGFILDELLDREKARPQTGP